MSSAQPPHNPDVVRCPKCGSNQVSASSRGFSAGKALIGRAIFGGKGYLAGFLGSKRVENYCKNCGNRWDPQIEYLKRKQGPQNPNSPVGCIAIVLFIIFLYYIFSQN